MIRFARAVRWFWRSCTPDEQRGIRLVLLLCAGLVAVAAFLNGST